MGVLFTGPDHHLTTELAADLSNLEITIHFKPHRPPDCRNDVLPASSLSWHDKQLAVIHKKSVVASNKPKSAAESRYSRSSNRSLINSTITSTSSSHNNNNKSDGKLSIVVVRKPNRTRADDNDQDERIESTKDILLSRDLDREEEARYDAVSIASGGFSDWSVDERSEVLNQRLSGFLDDVNPGSGNPGLKVDITETPKHVIITDKHQPPVPMLKKYYRTSSAPHVSTGRTNGYSVDSATSSFRPHSSMSVHRAYCRTPGPFAPLGTITCGPHCRLDSLLGDTVQRVRSQGPLHKSAFYHVPGRYSTSQKPYPPKRSQSRISATMLYSGSGSGSGSGARSGSAGSHPRSGKASSSKYSNCSSIVKMGKGYGDSTTVTY